MSVEKYIHGKVDDGKHAGLYCNRRRLQASSEALKESVILDDDDEDTQRSANALYGSAEEPIYASGLPAHYSHANRFRLDLRSQEQEVDKTDHTR